MMASTLFAAEPPKQDAVKKDQDEIQGTWKVTALEADGFQGPAEIVAALKLVFKDDTLTFTRGEPGFTNYRFKLDPTTKPANFDLTHADGSQKGKSLIEFDPTTTPANFDLSPADGLQKGKTDKGIYSLKGDRLIICFSEGKGRPKELTSKPMSGQFMYTLKRVKF